MKANIHNGLVYEFEDFLSDFEQEFLLSHIQGITETWDSAPNSFWKGKSTTFSNSFMDDIYKRIQELFISFDRINPLDAINRFHPGDSMGEHCDEVGHEEIKYGIVIYINGDFNGGEIFYPELGLTHKPKAKSLILHPGNLEHCVKEILPGPIRYFMTTFVHGTEEKPAVLKNANS
jgi:hypothetical protein